MNVSLFVFYVKNTKSETLIYIDFQSISAQPCRAEMFSKPIQMVMGGCLEDPGRMMGGCWEDDGRMLGGRWEDAGRMMEG